VAVHREEERRRPALEEGGVQHGVGGQDDCGAREGGGGCGEPVVSAGERSTPQADCREPMQGIDNYGA